MNKQIKTKTAAWISCMIILFSTFSFAGCSTDDETDEIFADVYFSLKSDIPAYEHIDISRIIEDYRVLIFDMRTKRKVADIKRYGDLRGGALTMERGIYRVICVYLSHIGRKAERDDFHGLYLLKSTVGVASDTLYVKSSNPINIVMPLQVKEITTFTENANGNPQYLSINYDTFDLQ